MRSNRRAVMVAFTVMALIVTGCATTTPITIQSGTPVPAARIHHADLAASGPGRTAKVSFLRDAGLWGAACAHKIMVDGKPVASLRAGEYHTLYVAPGQHALALEVEGAVCPKLSASRSVVLSDGGEETYRIVSTSGPRVAIVDATGGDPRAATSERSFT